MKSGHVAANPAHKRHPRREERRQRAAERLVAHVCTSQCKRFRTGRDGGIKQPTGDAIRALKAPVLTGLSARDGGAE